MRLVDGVYIVLITALILVGGYAVSEVAIAGSWVNYLNQ